MLRPKHVTLGRNNPETRQPYAQEAQKRAQPEEKAEGAPPHLLHVGKARPDMKPIPQPPAAELGIVPKVPFRLLFSGPSASGKSNCARFLLDKFFLKKNGFKRVVLMSPTANTDPTWEDCPAIAKKDRITKMSLAPVKAILREQEQKTKQGGREKCPQVLIVFDDAVGHNKLINSPAFLKVFIRGRHFGISAFLMSQSYTKIPRAVRLQSTALCVFPSHRSEIERLYEEHGPHQLSKKEFFGMVQEAMQKTPDEPYPFFYVDTDAPVSERYRRCLYQCIPVDENAGPAAGGAAEGGAAEGGDPKNRRKRDAAEGGDSKKRRKRDVK